MNRYFFEISYLGTSYHGWQRQNGQISVQQCIEESLSKFIPQKEVKIVGCGRTDTGVHAKQSFFHLDTEKTLPQQTHFKINTILPKDIAVNEIYKSKINQHARFDATQRTYRYYLHQKKDAFINKTSLYYRPKLDFELMQKAAQLLLGKKEFTSFAKLHADNKTDFCVVSHAQWNQTENQIYFEITADRFLRNMVRAITGTLLDVGQKKTSLLEFEKIIRDKNRSNAGASIEAHGLFLWKVKYPFELNNFDL
ncbi:MAG: tRNA pseudouridine(38-40) synthase TruA [Crocinitomicaceae bacterium]|nr:tRNA pseudouridine(38-40) synthase TruA [Crocinitomicaceae bacterium]